MPTCCPAGSIASISGACSRLLVATGTGAAAASSFCNRASEAAARGDAAHPAGNEVERRIDEGLQEIAGTSVHDRGRVGTRARRGTAPAWTSSSALPISPGSRRKCVSSIRMPMPRSSRQSPPVRAMCPCCSSCRVPRICQPALLRTSREEPGQEVLLLSAEKRNVLLQAQPSGTRMAPTRSRSSTAATWAAAVRRIALDRAATDPSFGTTSRVNRFLDGASILAGCRAGSRSAGDRRRFSGRALRKRLRRRSVLARSFSSSSRKRI